MKTRVGFIGLGRMGHPMCRHILRAGFPLTVFDVQAEAMQSLIAQGARGANSPREVAAQSDVILVMVANDEQVRQVVAGRDGLLGGAPRGAVIAICSSIHPETCRNLATQAEKHGVGLIDAPVARGLRGAEAGELAIFVGGEQKYLKACRAVFAAFAKSIMHMGPIGAGQITKTCNNLVHWAEVAACYEVLTFGARLGLHPNDLRPALVAGSADSRTLRELHLIGMYWPHKDIETAMELARASDTPLPLTGRVRELIARITAQDLRNLFEVRTGL